MCAVKNIPSGQTYITDDEHRKCQKVADAYAELEQDGILVMDAGKYGFVKLQYYTYPKGFDDVVTFTDSRAMFEDLWEEWFHSQLIAWAKSNRIGDVDYDDVFSRLSDREKEELMAKKDYFAEMSIGRAISADNECGAVYGAQPTGWG